MLGCRLATVKAGGAPSKRPAPGPSRDWGQGTRGCSLQRDPASTPKRHPPHTAQGDGAGHAGVQAQRQASSRLSCDPGDPRARQGQTLGHSQLDQAGFSACPLRSQLLKASLPIPPRVPPQPPEPRDGGAGPCGIWPRNRTGEPGARVWPDGSQPTCDPIPALGPKCHRPQRARRQLGRGALCLMRGVTRDPACLRLLRGLGRHLAHWVLPAQAHLCSRLGPP